MSRPLRVGMIGAGGIAGMHGEGWTRLKGVRLVAITDIVRSRAVERAKMFGIPDVEPSAGRLLARKDIDVVDIITPNRLHAPLTIAALAAGKHVLCEKPLALTAKDVDAMMAAAVKARRKLMCAQHQRFESTSLALKKYLMRHPLGEVYYARAWYLRRRMLPTREGFIFRRLSGGGACIDVGVHVLDLAMHLMDNFDPVSVDGLAVTKLARRPDSWSEWNWGCFDKKRLDVEDFAAALVRFADGAALTLECSWMLNTKIRQQQRIDLFGTEAGATWPECEYYDHTRHDFADKRLEVRQAAEKPYHTEIRLFAEAILGRTAVPVPPAQSRAVIAILEGLYRSQRLGRPVRLPRRVY
jgi:predicted dehydrogenase